MAESTPGFDPELDLEPTVSITETRRVLREYGLGKRAIAAALGTTLRPVGGRVSREALDAWVEKRRGALRAQGILPARW